jgi:putative ABC transport system permease protein
VAIVNESFIREYLPNRRPLEQRLSLGGLKEDLQVVGVVKDAVYQTLRQTPPPTVYASYLQMGGPATLVIYAPGSLAQVASAIRADVQQRLAGKPLRVRTLTRQMESSLAQERLMATLAGAFGALALLLAAIGLYGVLAYTVVQRTKDIGIRLALGARRTQVVRLVMGEAVRMLTLGAAIGLPIAWASSRFISSMLFGLSPNNAETVTGAIAVLAVTGLAAGLLPARRAANLDPLAALRCE